MASKRRNGFITADKNDIKKTKKESNEEESVSSTKSDNVKCLPKKAERKFLTEKELAIVREEIKRKQKAAMESPKLFLQLEDEGVLKRNGVPHISATDLQHLLLYTLHKNQASVKAKWCRFMRHNKLHSTLLVLVENITAEDFHQNTQSFAFLDASFPMRVHLINPGEYSMRLEEEMFSVALSHRQVILNNKVLGVKRQMDTFGRLDLLMDSFEMMVEGYAMPDRDSATCKYKYTKDKYQLPTQQSAMFGVDCEMVETSLSSHELAWVCVVDENLKVVYESLVLPKGRVTNYLTKYSGISEETLAGVTTRLKDVQKALRSILPPDAILVGQSLNYDLKALKMYHPFVIDTSCIFNLSGYRFKKPKLQMLSSLFLKRDIQKGLGHDPREDAEAAMQLLLLKLKKGMSYGDVLQGWKVGELEADVEKLNVVEATCLDDSRFKSGGGASEQNYKASNDPSEAKNELCNDNLNEDEKSELKSVFFRSHKYNMNLFKHFIAESKEVSLVNFQASLLEKTYGEDCGDKLRVISCDDEEEEKDKVAMRRCREEIQKGTNFLNTVRFSDVSSIGDCKNCFKRCLKNANKNIKKLHESLPDKTLIIVVLTGNGRADHSKDGLCFVKIKNNS